MNMMKKYLFMLAAFIAATATFTACSSEEDSVLDEEPVLGDAIKAQFTISIPTEAKGITRQSSSVVNSAQTINDFSGITSIKLYPSALLPNAFDGTASSKIIGRNIALTKLVIPTQTTVNNYIPDKTLLGTNNSVLYGDVQLQLGARTFLFYGMAIGKTLTYNTENKNYDITPKAWNALLDSYSVQEKFYNGFLNQVGLLETPTDVSGVNFSLAPITTNTNSNTKRTAIITYLNDIASADGWSGSTNAGLSSLYASYTGMRAGSSTNLQVAIKDLYFALIDNTNEVAQAICAKINNSTYVTIDATNKTLVFKDNIAGYPSASDNLPDGAAVLTWDATNHFSYSTEYVSTSTMTITNLGSYVYPACLYYWGKSGILTSKDSKASLYTASNTWATIATSANYEEGDAVTSKTRSVVLVNPIQYAVGRLDISLVAAASGTTLSTLADAGVGVNAHNVDVSKLKLTGILIGEQKQVDWKFEPVSTSSAQTIYDNILISQNNSAGLGFQTSHTTASGGHNVLNHTLVLETAGKVGDVNDKVNVALEFINNDQDFVGADGIVPKGCKFYLVGTLDAGAATGVSNYSNTGGKVFKQDYITSAKFTVANLSKAINTIPDLRNPQVELGLSVDLEWKQGIDFEVTIQ